jgi:hypothetical protein
LVSIGFGELQKRLKSAEHYAEQWKLKKPKALTLQGFSVLGID